RQLLKELTVFAERSVYDLFRQLMAAGAEGAADPAEGSSDRKPADAPPGDDRYRAFIISMLDGGLPPFFVAYPVLARHIALLMEKWVETTGDLSKRLDADRHAIAERFSGGADPGSVAAIAPALSDPHHGRRRVAALTFDSGLKLVYKPRDVGLEKAV